MGYPAAYKCSLAVCGCVSDVIGRCPVVYLCVLGGCMLHHPFLGDSGSAVATRPGGRHPHSGYCALVGLSLGVLS